MVTARVLVPALFLLAILTLHSRRVQSALAAALAGRPGLLFLAPAVLTAAFWAVLGWVGAWSAPLALLTAAYVFLPAGLAYGRGQGACARGVSWIDLGLICLLWLPLEFGAGGAWVPRPVQGLLHTAAYGLAILTALWIALLFLRLEGMKIRFPPARDAGYAVLGFLLVAPVLVVLGLWLGFIAPFHLPANLSAGLVLTRFALILAGTALPEEILFRGLIQNWLTQKLGPSVYTLLLASLIFGCAHLDNGPGPLPNWRYMVLASIAGFAYGKVFDRGTSVFASAILHALVNTTRHLFF